MLLCIGHVFWNIWTKQQWVRRKLSQWENEEIVNSRLNRQVACKRQHNDGMPLGEVVEHFYITVICGLRPPPTPEHLEMLPSAAQKRPARKAAEAAGRGASQARAPGGRDSQEPAYMHSGSE